MFGLPHVAAFGLEQAGPVLADFTFEEESPDSHNRSLADVMKLASELFEQRSGGSPPRPFCQVILIISDGRFNKGKVRPMVQAALAKQQLPLLVIVDAVSESARGECGKAGRRSLFDLKAVTYEGGQCKVLPYLQDFPFPHYIVVQDIGGLPGCLCSVLKQWFELAAAQ